MNISNPEKIYEVLKNINNQLQLIYLRWLRVVNHQIAISVGKILVQYCQYRLSRYHIIVSVDYVDENIISEAGDNVGLLYIAARNRAESIVNYLIVKHGINIVKDIGKTNDASYILSTVTDPKAAEILLFLGNGGSLCRATSFLYPIVDKKYTDIKDEIKHSITYIDICIKLNKLYLIESSFTEKERLKYLSICIGCTESYTR